MRYYKIYVDNTRELYTYEDREDNYLAQVIYMFDNR